MNQWSYSAKIISTFEWKHTWTKNLNSSRISKASISTVSKFWLVAAFWKTGGWKISASKFNHWHRREGVCVVKSLVLELYRKERVTKSSQGYSKWCWHREATQARRLGSQNYVRGVLSLGSKYKNREAAEVFFVLWFLQLLSFVYFLFSTRCKFSLDLIPYEKITL